MTLDKIRHLIARAAHPGTPVEEARTSAVIACKLIVEHAVDLRLPNEPVTTPGFDWLDLLATLVRVAAKDQRTRVSPNNPRPYRANSDTAWPSKTKQRRERRRAKRAKKRGTP